ncbi:MAG: T9SS type A sorting domain-containing protein [Bacteroidota bacterium]
MRNILTTSILLIALAINVYAQCGDNDTTFYQGSGANYSVLATSIQSDGKIIVAGSFSDFNGLAKDYIVRLNTDGSVDTTFNLGVGANSAILATAIQSDGKIIVGGYFTTYNGTACNSIARLNTNGSLDSTFNVGTGANDCVYATALQSDGKIIIVGYFTSYNGSARKYIARLNSDGSLDGSFNIGTGADGWVFTTAIQNDGKIIIGGMFSYYNGTSTSRIARLNTDGSIDASFNIGAGPNGSVDAITIQNDEKIIIAGMFSSYNGTSGNSIARLNPDGSYDSTFNVGTGADNTIENTAIQNDGKVIIGGMFTSYNGTGISRIARLNADGSLDATFDVGAGANDIVYSTAIQNDGRIIIGGDFTFYKGTGRNRIARIINCNNSTDSIAETVCNSYTAPDGQIYTTSGVITAVIPNTAGCDSTITINLTVNTVDISVSQNSTILTANTTSAAYQWLDCINGNSPIVGENGQSYTATVNGSYAVIINDGFCVDTSTCYTISSIGIEQNSTPDNFIVYPNPASNYFIFQTPVTNQNQIILIRNVLGQHIMTCNIKRNQTYIDISKLENGVYFVEITLENNIKREKFIKQ